MSGHKIGFIGAGNMATALIKGRLAKGDVDATQIRCSDPSPERRKWMQEELAIASADTNSELVNWADVLVIAVKPQVAQAVVTECASAFGKQHLLLSVCAGITLAQLTSWLPPGVRCMRAMPNTPAFVGAGASAIVAGEGATESDRKVSQQIFEGVGLCVEVEERYMDAVTGLSGSGPAFVMLMIEALTDGAVLAGLPRAIASQLATQTVLGSAQLVAESGQHPALLKDQVTSPGGTTITGVARLEAGGFRSTLIGAVQAAAARATELGK